MQKFILLHDGSDQGWQATYLALHIAARLGAPLQVLHIRGETDPGTIKQRAAQVEVSGYAAGVNIETRFLEDLSMDGLAKTVNTVDGFFLPQAILADRETVSRILEVYACPLWVASQEPEIHMMAVLVEDPEADAQLIEYSTSLSNRLGQSLTGLIHRKKTMREFRQGTSDMFWLPLPKISPGAITSSLKRINAGLLILSASRSSLAGSLLCNCILYPGRALK